MDADIIAALNGLLEEERADTEALVGLVAMATDTFERQALTAMGGQAAQGCIDLHDRLARLGVSISARVSNSVNVILRHERIDDRLRAFAEVQRYLAGRCESLRERNLDDETRALLVELREVQQVHAAWAEHRAEEFAATRPTDVESSSPSHAMPQSETPPQPAAGPATMDTMDTMDPADMTDGGGLADTAYTDDALPAVPTDDGGAVATTIAVDEPSSAAPSSALADATALDPVRAAVPVETEGVAPAAPAIKPRARRARVVGAQALPRRTSKKP